MQQRLLQRFGFRSCELQSQPLSRFSSFLNLSSSNGETILKRASSSTLMKQSASFSLFRISKFSPFSSRFNSSSNDNPIDLKNVKILGIETSCDDTGIAIVNGEGNVLAQQISSNPKLHEEWGGIVPGIAAREHERVIDPLLEAVMKESELNFSDLNAIAVTMGPGLISSLRVGVKKAKELAIQHNLPLIPINHLEGHSLVTRLNQRTPSFPFLILLVSGGHTQILLCKNVGEYIHLGGTLDDSVGECFDKVARILQLPWTEGGQGVEKLALTGDPTQHVFSLPMKKYKNCDLSFSGLKSQVVRLHGKKVDLAASFQLAAINHIKSRLENAMNWVKKNVDETSSLVVVGGVARNQMLRTSIQGLCQEKNFQVHFPDLQYCTDNGVMIAWAGMENYLQGKNILTEKEQIEQVYEIAKLPLADNQNVFETKYKGQVAILKRMGISQKFISTLAADVSKTFQQ